MPINQNTGLFALLGTAFGGDGVTTFGIPDLQGRVAIGTGQGSGLPNYNLGDKAGATSVTLTIANLAAHTHVGGLNIVTTGRGVKPEPPVAGDFLYATQSVSASSSPSTIGLGGVTTQSTGNSQPFSIMPPYIALNYCICASGLYPSRS